MNPKNNIDKETAEANEGGDDIVWIPVQQHKPEVSKFNITGMEASNGD